MPDESGYSEDKKVSLKRARKPERSESMTFTREYIQRICQTPLITKEEEIDLAERISSGDKNEKDNASQKLIESNLRLVVKIAHQFANFGMPIRDLISAGSVGLIKATEKFAPDKGARFATYAVWWIKQSIHRALDNQSRTIRIPVQSATNIKKIRAASNKLTKKLGYTPSDAEISDETGISEKTVGKLKHADLRLHSLNETMLEGEDGELGDIIPDTNAASPAQILDDLDSSDHILKMIDGLNEREKYIIVRRFGLDGEPEMTLEEISQNIGVTRERVRQIQNNAFHKMRGKLSASR